MNDIAHIRLVDAHAEGDGRDHDDAALGHEAVLVGLARFLAHAGMIGQRLDAFAGQKCGRLLGLAPRQAIDDAAGAGMARNRVEKLALPFLLRRDGETDIGPVETEHQRLDIAAEKPRGDIGPRRLVGGRGQRRDRHAGEEVAQPRQILIFAPEGRSPLRNAMRLVDRDELDVETLQRGQHARGHQPFGREIEEPRLAGSRAAPGSDIVLARLRRIDAVGGDAGQPERRDLVLHQRHQRRDDEREAARHQRRHLEAERFARAGRHDGEEMAARQQHAHGLLLAGAERVEAENVFQDLPRGCGNIHRGAVREEEANRVPSLACMAPQEKLRSGAAARPVR